MVGPRNPQNEVGLLLLQPKELCQFMSESAFTKTEMRQREIDVALLTWFADRSQEIHNDCEVVTRRRGWNMPLEGVTEHRHKINLEVWLSIRTERVDIP